MRAGYTFCVSLPESSMRQHFNSAVNLSPAVHCRQPTWQRAFQEIHQGLSASHAYVQVPFKPQLLRNLA